jgi:ubiquinone/menaquinone biosynthesis C-methylase UbiE
MRSLSFDNMVHFYEETRVSHPVYLKAALDDLVKRFPPSTHQRLLEPGIGTGRMAVPLVHRGYQVTGVDISRRMLALLRRRVVRDKKPLPLSFLAADAAYLPFPDEIFDIAIAVHLFYFISNWKQAADEMLRVVKPGSPLVLMHTGTGMEIPYLNQRYKELCAEYGYTIASIGVTSTAEVVAYFMTRSCKVDPVASDWQWTSRIRLENALGYIRSRAYSFTVSASDSIHNAVMEQLSWEVQQKYGSLAHRVSVPNRIYYTVVMQL